jgi:hypothetical protein
MIPLVLTLLVGLAAVALLDIARARLRIWRRMRFRRRLHALRGKPHQAWTTRQSPPQSDTPQAWVVTTDDGQCAVFSEAAGRILSLDAYDPATEPLRLQQLLVNGTNELNGIAEELRRCAYAPPRPVRLKTRPSENIALTAVALRDRAGNCWGSAFLFQAV